MKKTMMKSLEKRNPIVIDTETTSKNPHKANLLGVSYKIGKDTSYREGAFIPDELIEPFEREFVIAHNGKYDSVVLSKHNVDIKIGFDTMIAQYILHIDKLKKLEECVLQHFNEYKEDLLQVYNKVTNLERKTLPDKWWMDIPQDFLAQYAKEDAKWTYKLFEKLRKDLVKNAILEKWFYEVEIPLVNILTESELKGVKVDTAYLQVLKSDFEVKKSRLEARLKWLADNIDINLNSSQQVQEILYKKFDLPQLKKTKTGISTDHKTLEKLAVKHLFPKLLLQLREISKLLSTFVEPLIEHADNDGRIHATYNQCGTKTRRMSCSEPNLQQIPVKTEIGKQLRNVFIPEKEYKFLVADYDQIELRLLAHFSQDPVLLDIYNRQDGDIHAETMKTLCLKRIDAKIFNFSLVYGKTPYGLAQDFNCSQQEAQNLIDKWFKQFPKVKDYINSQEYNIYLNKGWTKSLAGLPLYCGNPDINNKKEYSGIMRKAVNYPIQASSQDVLKKAVVNVHKRIDAVPLLLVHDELVYELHESVLEGSQHMAGRSTGHPEIIVKEMENAWKLRVPLKVSWKISDRWEK